MLTISDRTLRIVLVTAGLSAVGALAGAGSSVVALSLIAVIEGGVRSLASRELGGLLGIAGAVGALVGTIGGPTVSCAHAVHKMSTERGNVGFIEF